MFFYHISHEDGRKRAKTMEYMDDKVVINEDDQSQSNTHIGQHIHAQFDMSILDETVADESVLEPVNRPNPSIATKVKKQRDSERLQLSRRMSDISFSGFNDTLNKTTTEFKGRDHVLRVMKTTTNRPSMEPKNYKAVQEIMGKRQTTNAPISEFALNYGLMDNNGKQSKSRQASEFV